MARLRDHPRFRFFLFFLLTTLGLGGALRLEQLGANSAFQASNRISVLEHRPQLSDKPSHGRAGERSSRAILFLGRAP